MRKVVCVYAYQLKTGSRVTPLVSMSKTDLRAAPIPYHVDT